MYIYMIFLFKSTSISQRSLNKQIPHFLDAKLKTKALREELAAPKTLAPPPASASASDVSALSTSRTEVSTVTLGGGMKGRGVRVVSN